METDGGNLHPPLFTTTIQLIFTRGAIRTLTVSLSPSYLKTSNISDSSESSRGGVEELWGHEVPGCLPGRGSRREKAGLL